MIEPMKKVFLIVQTHNKKEMLKKLRKAGLVHVIEAEKPRSTEIEELGKRSESLSRIHAALVEATDAKHPVEQKHLDEDAFVELTQQLDKELAERKTLQDLVTRDEREAERLAPWGEFSLDDIAALANQGIRLDFYTIGRKELDGLKDVPYLELDSVEGLAAFATVNGTGGYIPGATKFELPEKSLSFLRTEIKESNARIDEIGHDIQMAVSYREEVEKAIKLTEQDVRFEHVALSMDGDEDICYLEGYLPARKEADFQKLAKENAWGYDTEEPEGEDNPPTLLRYPKGFGIMQPIYDILGTLPGYRERDISVWFLLFFVVFFAMIVGDAGYGLVFVIIGLLLRKKAGKGTAASNLVTLLGGGTVVWGALTGTWFGSQLIMEHLPFLQKLVIPQLTNFPETEMFSQVTSKDVQNTMMGFCFLLGTIQLSLACVMNIVYKAGKKNISLLADVGWLLDILALYQVILMLVFSKKIDTTLAFSTVGVGFALVLVFGNQGPGVKFGDGLKTGLAGFLPTFLNTISCFSNTMSYIRLYAVGMAGFAIGNSFDTMAEGVFRSAPLLVGVIGFLFVVLIGHSLNLVMSLLSVIVHGIRLNILEFSNQLGMEWSGYKYDPFRETVKEN